MKIALVTFEYPPDTGIGGIATYFYQLADLLHRRGHYVEVFSNSYQNERSSYEGNNFLVHRIKTENKYSFKNDIVVKFSERHSIVCFDLFESPEYMADGLMIKQKYPQLPLVVKLHTPDFLVKELNGISSMKPSWMQQIKNLSASILKFKKPKNDWKYNFKNDVEYRLVCLADLISSPSISLRKIVSQKWHIDENKIKLIPYSYLPKKTSTTVNINSHTQIVTYIGRLEVRKGVDIFTKVIPLVVSSFPNVKFRFIGKDLPSPEKNCQMKGFLTRELREYSTYLEFIDHCSSEDINQYLAQADICVFPSVWENFPNVCLEAMSAGKAIVASKEGGMLDMLDNPPAGILVNPKSVISIADSIISLLRDPLLRERLGVQAKLSVNEKYNDITIGQLIETNYMQILKSNRNF